MGNEIELSLSLSTNRLLSEIIISIVQPY